MRKVYRVWLLFRLLLAENVFLFSWRWGLEYDWNISSQKSGWSSRWSDGSQTSPADIRANTCMSSPCFSPPRRDASSISSSLSGALLSARTCARQYRSKQPPRNSARRLDFTRETIPRISFLSPRIKENKIKGGENYFVFRPSV